MLESKVVVKKWITSIIHHICKLRDCQLRAKKDRKLENHDRQGVEQTLYIEEYFRSKFSS